MTNMGQFTFVAYLGARILMALASSMLSVAIGWHLYLFSGDPFDLALVGLMQILPMLVLFIVSGWVVDHFPRKMILVICGFIESLVYIGLALSMNQGDLDRIQIFSLLLLHGTARAFYSPASQAILPNIVSSQFLPRAVAITSATWTTAQTLGPLGAGVLLAWVDYGTYWALVTLAATGGALFLCLPTLHIHKPQERGLQHLLGGIRYVFGDPIVLPSISLDLFIVLAGGVMALLPVFAIDVLHVDTTTLGLMRAMPALGGVVMGLLLARLPPLRQSGKLLFIALGIFAGSILLFALSNVLWLSLTALWIYGAADMVSVNIRSTLIQLATPDSLRGRVSAVNMLFIGVSNEMGDFRAGAVAAILGPVATVLTGAAMAFGITIGGSMIFSRLRALDKLTDAECPDNQDTAA
jgi:MFS family permease